MFLCCLVCRAVKRKRVVFALCKLRDEERHFGSHCELQTDCTLQVEVVHAMAEIGCSSSHVALKPSTSAADIQTSSFDLDALAAAEAAGASPAPNNNGSRAASQAAGG